LLAGVTVGVFQGAMSALIGISSFVVTLAGLLGFQGLMLKILGIHGAINVRDSFIRGITTTTLLIELGWAVVVVCTGLFAWSVWQNRKRRLRLFLEVNTQLSAIIKVLIFARFFTSVVATLNSYRGVPLVVIILLILTFILGWATISTPFGRYLFAVGGNAESERRAGISLQVVKIAAFGVLGFIAAIGGIIGASRYTSVSFNTFAGGPLLLEAIGAAIIGGTSLFSGRGSVWNAILCALVIGSLGNGLDLSGAKAADKLMFSGGILLLAVSVDALSRRSRT
jgi:D-xylose transport system permease protein